MKRVFSLGYKVNSVYQEDFFIAVTNIDNESIDLVVTDVPYGIDYQSNWGRGKDKVKLKKIANDNNLSQWFPTFANEMYRVLKDNSALYCFTRFDTYPLMYNNLVKSGFNVKNLLVLQKGQRGGNGDLQAQFSNDCELLIYANKGRRKFNTTHLVPTDGRKGANPYRKRLPNVWFDNTELNQVYPKSTINVSSQGKDYHIIHPTEKNVDLLRWLIQLSSSDKDTVLDPFMGSGSLAEAAILENRNFLGFETDGDYIDLINHRLSKYKNP